MSIPALSKMGGFHMGYGGMCHHTIVVTGMYDDDGNVTRAKPSVVLVHDLRHAHMKAVEIFHGRLVSPIIKGVVNRYGSFFVAPDGSFEGWNHSDEGDANREALIKWLDSKRNQDASSPYTWAEIQFGNEGGDQRILRHSCQPPKNLLDRIAEDVPIDTLQNKG
jgi:hypothetical protein